MNRCRIVVLAALSALIALLAVAPGAGASFHLMKIREISGETGTSNVSFIELQMYGPGQNFVAGHNITIWDQDAFVSTMAQPVATLPLVGLNPPNGDNQRTILIGDTAVTGRDFTLELSPYFDVSTGGNVGAAGAACFDSIPVDCVSWGGAAFTGANNLPDKTTPFSGALTVGTLSLRRKITANCATALDAADDTNNAAVDFTNVAYGPTPNSATPVETLCPSAGTPGKKVRRRKCKKKPSKNSVVVAKKKKCKKKK